MYVRVFTQILNSSVANDWQVRHVFEDLFKLADDEGNVDMTLEAVARQLNVPLKIVKRAIGKLMEPDPESRSPDCEGRRIIPLAEGRSWGWRIVNYGRYRKIFSEEHRREYMRELMRHRRAEGSKQTVAESKQGKGSVDPALAGVSTSLAPVSTSLAPVNTSLAPVENGKQPVSPIYEYSNEYANEYEDADEYEDESEDENNERPPSPVLGENTTDQFLLTLYQRLHGVTRSPQTVLAKIESARSWGIPGKRIEERMYEVRNDGIKAEIWDILDPLVNEKKKPKRDMREDWEKT